MRRRDIFYCGLLFGRVFHQEREEVRDLTFCDTFPSDTVEVLAAAVAALGNFLKNHQTLTAWCFTGIHGLEHQIRDSSVVLNYVCKC